MHGLRRLKFSSHLSSLPLPLLLDDDETALRVLSMGLPIGLFFSPAAPGGEALDFRRREEAGESFEGRDGSSSTSSSSPSSDDEDDDE